MTGIWQSPSKKISCSLIFLSPLVLFCYYSLNSYRKSQDIHSLSFKAPPKLVFESCYAHSQSSFQAGEGSPTYPYVICNFTQLKNIYLNLNAHYILGQDINASKTMQKSYNQGRGWEPITPFRGDFNGRGFTIYNLYLRHTMGGNSLFSGFFGQLNKGARVHSLGIKNINIIITFSRHPEAISIFAGCLAASSDKAIVSNSYAKGKITIQNTSNHLRAELGGLIGYQDNGHTKQSYADCDIYLHSLASLGSTNIGGLVGLSAGREGIEDSYAKGKITTATKKAPHVGALIGKNISGAESFKGINYYLKGEIKNAVGYGSCRSKNCIAQKADELQNMDETIAPLYWDTTLWLARNNGSACLRNAGPYKQSCP